MSCTSGTKSQDNGFSWHRGWDILDWDLNWPDSGVSGCWVRPNGQTPPCPGRVRATPLQGDQSSASWSRIDNKLWLTGQEERTEFRTSISRVRVLKCRTEKLKIKEYVSTKRNRVPTRSRNPGNFEFGAVCEFSVSTGRCHPVMASIRFLFGLHTRVQRLAALAPK